MASSALSQIDVSVLINSRKKFIDEYKILRVLATIMVVLGHSTYFVIEGSLGGVEYIVPEGILLSRLYNFFCYAQYIIYKFHMPLFFFLSGCLYYVSNFKKEYTIAFYPFLLSKVKRLLYPYLIAGLLFLIPVKFISGYYSNTKIIDAIWYGLILGRDSGHLWFLTTLFYVFITFFIIEKFIIKYNFWVGAITIFLLFFLNDKLLVPLPCFINVFRYLFWFYIGFLFEKYRLKVNDIIIRYPTISVSSTIWSFAIINFLTMYADRIDNFTIFSTGAVFIMKTLLTFLGILVTYVISLLLSQWQFFNCSKVVSILDKYSMDIYLFHDPLNYFILFAISILNDFFILQYKSGILLFLLLRTVGVIIVAIIIALGLKEIRGLNHKEQVKC
ncbi:fucose 4-O-acetylase-like acetyltransferase [Desulfitobacterium sp. LBE]|uniref:acyltransferase family protein n=1 Tax=Desulfitobacterium sp. LBE TaxID=884086 RepID=UPI00119B905D|nr:acyltransferase [Desulfitobacterium sp. LBE]TWH59728.1 fucose 4-O-acetylase-like acetyltransferase [Desulfitobacterium sp. LBE]